MALSAEAPTRPPPLRRVDGEHVLADQPTTMPVRRGPLLAVCGLAGGAGTTTLAYLVATETTASQSVQSSASLYTHVPLALCRPAHKWRAHGTD
jgi:hypothetical protein